MSSIERRVLASGKVSWRAHYRTSDGRLRNKSFALKRDAERFLSNVDGSKTAGTFVDPSRARVTVGDMAAQWLAGKVNLKPTTRARYEDVLRTHILPSWDRVALGRVEHGAIQAWVADLAARGLAGASVRKAHGILSGVLALAIKDRRLSANPAAGMNLPRLNATRRRYLTAVQVEHLADAADQGRVALLVLSYCGLRWSELAGLRVSSVDLLRRRLDITAAVTEVNGGRLVWGTPKSHERRSVPIPRFLAEELATHLIGRDRDDLVFAAPEGGVLRNRNARRAWFDAAASAIGTPGLTPHELRHTAASLAVSAGANVKAVQRMLGHASAALTLDTYADLFDDDLNAVADRLDDVRRTAYEISVANPLPQAAVVDLASRDEVVGPKQIRGL